MLWVVINAFFFVYSNNRVKKRFTIDVYLSFDMIIFSLNIHTIPRTLPTKVFGALSPYPTVVMVTADHQNPEPTPDRVLPPNCSGFLFFSKNHTSSPTEDSSRARVKTIFKNSKEKKRLKTVNQAFFFCCMIAMPRPLVWNGWVKSKRFSLSEVMVSAATAALTDLLSTADNNPARSYSLYS